MFRSSDRCFPFEIPICFKLVKGDKVLSNIHSICDLQLHYVITFSGRLDQARLSKSVRLSLDAEPVLGCRLVKNRWHQCWQRRDDLNELELCRLTKTDCPQEALISYMAAPSDPYEDPMIQAHIFRSDTDILCIKANHIVSDAGGLKEYVRLLASIYRNIGSDPKFKPQMNLLGRRSCKQVTELFSLFDKLKILRLSLVNWLDNLYPNKNWHFPFLQVQPTTDRSFFIRRIPTDQFQQIKQFAVHHSFTINDILTACIFRALYKIIQPDSDTPLRLGVTVNLRRYILGGQGEALANLSKMFLLNIGCHIGDTLQETISLVHDHMKIHKENYIGLDINKNSIFSVQWLPVPLAHIFHNFILRLNRFIGPKNIPPWFTNMGLLDRKDMEFGEIKTTDVFMTAPIVYAPFLAIGATGFSNSITISIGFCKTSHDGEKITNLLDTIEKEIRVFSELLQ